MYFYCHVYVFLLYVPVSPSCQLALFGYPDWGFSVLFLSCKANARVKPPKTGHSPHCSNILCCSMYCLFCVVLCIMWVWVSVWVCVRVCKCVLYYCHRVATQLQFTNISYRIVPYHSISLFFFIYAYVSQAVSLAQVSPAKLYMQLLSPPHVPHALPISFFPKGLFNPKVLSSVSHYVKPVLFRRFRLWNPFLDWNISLNPITVVELAI